MSDDPSDGPSDQRQTREAKLAALRAALIEGEESGPAKAFDVDAFIAEMAREAEP